MEYEIKPKGRLNLGLKELWAYHELFYFFTWRDIKVKYKQTLLGFAWALLQPVVMVTLFTLFLGQSIAGKVALDLPYPVFALSGFLLWNIFSSGLSNAGNSMVNNANIIKKIYFPRLIIPLSAILVSLFDFFVSIVVFIAVLIYYKIHVNASAVLFVPLSLLLTCISTFGLGTLLSALNVKYRDFRYLIPFFIQALMFATPVIYPVRIAGEGFIYHLLALNPMTAPIELFRCGFSHAAPDAGILALSGGVSIILFLTGLMYFRKTESYFADLA